MQSFLNVITLQTFTFFTTLTPRLHGRSKRFFRRPQNLNAPRMSRSPTDFLPFFYQKKHPFTLLNSPCVLHVRTVHLIIINLITQTYYLNSKHSDCPFTLRNLHINGIAQSVQRLATGWAVLGSNSGGGRDFRTRPDRTWRPPCLLYNGYRVFPGGSAAGVWG